MSKPICTVEISKHHITVNGQPTPWDSKAVWNSAHAATGKPWPDNGILFVDAYRDTIEVSAEGIPGLCERRWVKVEGLWLWMHRLFWRNLPKALAHYRAEKIDPGNLVQQLFKRLPGAPNANKRSTRH